MTSPDGITWTSRTSAADNDWYGVTYGNGLFVAVSLSGTGNRVMTSPDGITWTSRTSAADNNWYCVAYGNNLFVAVSISGTGNRVMTLSLSLFKNHEILALMNGRDTEATDTGGGNAWQVHGQGDFRAPFYVAKDGIYTLHVSLRCKCNTAARAWRVKIDNKTISMGNNTSGIYTVLTASLLNQFLTAGWKTVAVWHYEDSTSRTYLITDLNVGIIEN